MPFVTDRLWRTLVSTGRVGAPRGLARGRRTRSGPSRRGRGGAPSRHARPPGASTLGLKLRQPLRRLVVEGASFEGHLDEVADELRVKAVEFGDVEAVELHVKPNLPVLGPKLGKELAAVRAALAAGEFEELPADGSAHWGTSSSPTRCSSSAEGARAGRSLRGTVSSSRSTSASTPSWCSRGEAYDLIHRVNTLRKEQGFELTDRIVLTRARGAARAASNATATGSSVKCWPRRSTSARSSRSGGARPRPFRRGGARPGAGR